MMLHGVYRVRWIIRVIGLFVWLLAFSIISLPALAQTQSRPILNENLKAALQATMLEFIDNAAETDGGFRYIDRKDGQIRIMYPGAIHPKIIPIGEDYFLCIEMMEANGTQRLVDFLVRDGAAGLMVVDVMVDRRDLVKKALAYAD